MDMFALLQSVVLGLVEGLTEFLPISSTGHLIIAGDLLSYTGEQAKTFEIVIQLGAILAVCWHYRQRLLAVVAGLSTQERSRRFVLNLIIGVFPSALFGLLLHKLIKAYRGLRVDDFARFVGFFQAAGYDLSATDAQGHDFVALIQDQRQAAPYIDVIHAARA